MIAGKPAIVGAVPLGNLNTVFQATGPAVMRIKPDVPATALVGAGTVIALQVQWLPVERSNAPAVIVRSVV